jgi:predicted histone-like DNA-binding protein
MFQYKSIQRTDPRDPALPKKYYAAPVNNVPITERELKKEIARFTTVSGPDIGAVIDALFEIIPDLLKRGHRIQLGDLGAIYPTLESEGVDTEDEVTSDSIKQVRVRFRIGKWLKQAMTFLEFSKIENGNGKENGQTQKKKS